jgi:hypothetical protein
MATKNKMIRIASLLMAMLIVSISCVTAVSAKADISQKEGNADVVVLKETDREKVTSVTKKDGSIEYAISWKDEKNPNKIHFAVVEQKELVAQNLVSTKSLQNNGVVTNAVLASKVKFDSGSYVEKYGNSISGGYHVYLSAKDAGLLKDGSAALAALAAGLVSLSLSPAVAYAVAAVVAIAVSVYYWYEENSDGTLDIWIPYANIVSVLVTHHIYMKVGHDWIKV